MKITGTALTLVLFFLLSPSLLLAYETRLECKSAPSLIVSPKTETVASGATVYYNITVINNNKNDVCGVQIYTLTPSSSSYINVLTRSELLTVSVENQKSKNATLAVWSNTSTPVGNYTITITAKSAGETASLNTTTATYSVNRTSVPPTDLYVSRLDWHCEDAEGRSHDKYCRSGDSFLVDEVGISNAGNTFRGKLTLGANTSELSGMSLFTENENGTTIPQDAETAMKIKFPVKIRGAAKVFVQFTIYPTPADPATNNAVTIEIEATDKEGCQYRFPDCEAGFVCKKNKCIDNSSKATPAASEAARVKIEPKQKPERKLREFKPISEEPSEIGEACAYNSDCATAYCRRRSCAAKPETVSDQAAEVLKDVAWGLAHLGELLS